MHLLRRSPATARSRYALIAGLAGLWLCVACAQERAPEHPSGWTDKRPVESRHFMVAATGGLTVLQILKILEPYDVAAGAPPERSGSARKIAWAEDAALEFPSTSPISVVDRSGNAVAMTTTIEFAFGSKLMTKSGFLLNNEITDFSFVPFEDGTRVID